MRNRLEPYVERFVLFAIPGPDATPQELRRRGRVVAVCALAIMVVASLVYAYIGSVRQHALIAQAVQLRTDQTCQRVVHDVLIACLTQARWDAAGPEVQRAWIAGEVYTNPTITAIHVQGPDGSRIFEQLVRVARPNHSSKPAL